MLNDEIGIEVLNGLYAYMSKDFKGTVAISFPGEVWLGLLTVMPKADKSAYDDGTYFKELSDPNYMRFRLDAESRINKLYIMTPAEDGEVVTTEDGDRMKPTVTRNQAPIIFPENYVPEALAGFGLFRSADTSDTTTLPFLWGEVSDPDGEENVFLDAEEIPVIREGNLEIIMQ